MKGARLASVPVVCALVSACSVLQPSAIKGALAYIVRTPSVTGLRETMKVSGYLHCVLALTLTSACINKGDTNVVSNG